MEVLIRPIRTDDTTAVLSLYREAILDVPTVMYSPNILREWANRTAEEFVGLGASRTRYVAQIATTVVGYAGLDHERSTLTECYVAPAVQNAGIGRSLVSHVIALGRDTGLLQLSVLASTNAAPFYAKMGFSPQDGEGLTMANGQILPCIRMIINFAQEKLGQLSET